MNILAIGDVFGKPGMRALHECLPRLVPERKIDLVIANGENIAGGFGMTEELVKELFSMGVDVVTGGNHTWDKNEIFPMLDREPRLLRPANYPQGNPGHGTVVVRSRSGVEVGVANLEGRVFMPTSCGDPFRAADLALAELSQKAKVRVLDFHAEASSEKRAMGFHVDGRFSFVFGTHTHIPTADPWVLPKGTGYVSDVGMSGSDESVIGMKIEDALKRFLVGHSIRSEVGKRWPVFRSVLCDVDEHTGKARSLERVDVRLPDLA
ncbi:MAG TPA: TIGR00282 family metallophosphoesterase [bacterium]|nr:TIGR00282 family metallophosphoesterase [bacterium]